MPIESPPDHSPSPSWARPASSGRTIDLDPRRARAPRRRAAPAGVPRRTAAASRSQGRDWPVEVATPEAFEGVDIALFSAGGGASQASRRRPPRAAPSSSTTRRSGAWSPGVPLVVAGVNDADAAEHEGIVANPNCSTMQLMPLFAALRDSVGIERVIVDTYQSVSGTGNKAVAELEGAGRRPTRRAEPLEASVYPHPIAFNALPHIDVFLDERLHQGGVEGRHRSRARSSTCPTCAISCTAVRVPVFTSHSEAVHVELGDRMTPTRRASSSRASPASSCATTPRTTSYPLRHRGARQRRGLRGPHPPGRLAPGPSAAWPSGSSRTTSARARRRTPCRSPSSCTRTTGWRRRRAAPSGSRDPGRTTGRRSKPSRAKSASVIAAGCPRSGRTRSPARAHPDTEVVFVGEGPGQREDEPGAGPSSAPPASLLDELLGLVGWQREEVFITNVVKCRPPGNRDPEPDEIAACRPYLQRQLEVLDPALVVTLGRSQPADVHARGRASARSHGTARPVDRRHRCASGDARTRCTTRPRRSDRPR